jgi:hypothetical protein
MVTNVHHRLIRAMILSVFSLTGACAAARKMECREWDKGVGGGLMGTYVFSLDDNGTLDVLSTPCKSNCSGVLQGGHEEAGLLFPKCPSGDFLIPSNHFDSMDAFLILDSRGLQCGRTRTGRSTTAIT